MTQYGLDPEQLIEYVIRPTLNYLDMGGKQAEALVLGTGMVESNLRAIQQYGGPARSIYQIEPTTHDDHWDNFLEYRGNLKQKVSDLCGYNGLGQWGRVDELWGNLPYATAMCRLKYWRSPNPLPPMDADAMGQYWKDIYNSHLGAGDAKKAADHFNNAINHVKRI
jgi:hypothetical protein